MFRSCRLKVNAQPIISGKSFPCNLLANLIFNLKLYTCDQRTLLYFQSMTLIGKIQQLSKIAALYEVVVVFCCENMFVYFMKYGWALVEIQRTFGQHLK